MTMFYNSQFYLECWIDSKLEERALKNDPLPSDDDGFYFFVHDLLDSCRPGLDRDTDDYCDLLDYGIEYLKGELVAN